MGKETRLTLDVHLEQDGEQLGHICLPWSKNEDAYNRIQIPIAVFRNGDGPTLLLTAGTHGDEYEGQVALCRLIQDLRWEDIKGRVIVIPALNLPAVLNDSRLSPYDGGNLNRAYPGDPDGGPTAQIAYFMAHELFPQATYYHDLHSGGGSLNHMVLPAVFLTGEKLLDQKAFRALKAFGGPSALVLHPTTKDNRLATTAANDAGCVALAGEFGGSAVINPSGLKLLERGLRNLMGHIGILPASEAKPSGERQTFYTFDDDNFNVYCGADGIFEPVVSLGQAVNAGDLMGFVHNVHFPAQKPWEARFSVSGTVICLRARAVCKIGNCLGHVGRVVGEDSFGL